MTPAGRMQTAIDGLAAILAAPTQPADRTLNAFLRARRYVGSKDRRAVTGRIWTVIRHRAKLDWWTAFALGKVPEDPPAHARALILAGLALFRDRAADPDDDPKTGFAPDPHGPAPLDRSERRMIDRLKARTLDRHPDMPNWVRLECPSWMLERLRADGLAGLEEELLAQSVEAPLDLRVNLLKADPETARAALADAGIGASPVAISPLALRIETRVNIAASQPFRDGLVEVQDAGSQAVADLVDAAPGMAVCDFCAGAGGKTLALAAHMRNKGRLAATDTAAPRLKRARERLKRAGVDNAQLKTLTSETDRWVRNNAGKFDRVLVDAPCTGSGTWRRAPDSRWRLHPADLDELIVKQTAILAAAAGLVKPGGRLIYATCSILAAENAERIAAFLGAHDGFRRLAVQDIRPYLPGPGPDLVLSPHRHGTDGFYAAVLERIS